MEQEECHSLAAILLAPTKISRLLYNNNTIFHNMICLWKQIKPSYKLKFISSALPIDRNPTFAPFGWFAPSGSQSGIRKVSKNILDTTCVYKKLQQKQTKKKPMHKTITLPMIM